MLDNGVTTWMYAKLYSRQRIVGIQLLPIYNKTTGTSMFKSEVNLLTTVSTQGANAGYRERLMSCKKICGKILRSSDGNLAVKELISYKRSIDHNVPVD